MCPLIANFICGGNELLPEIDPAVVPEMFKHISHSIGVKQLNHFSQLTKSGVFRMFDYGDLNPTKYNGSGPPLYQLNNVEVPTYIYSGSQDNIISEIDVEHLSRVLPNVRKYRSMKNFNHCDFNHGKDSRIYLYEEMLDDINSEGTVCGLFDVIGFEMIPKIRHCAMRLFRRQ